jgi:hypothetical protein
MRIFVNHLVSLKILHNNAFLGKYALVAIINETEFHCQLTGTSFARLIKNNFKNYEMQAKF